MNLLQTHITSITNIICKKLSIKEVDIQKKINTVVTTKCLEEVEKFIQSELEGDYAFEFKEDVSTALHAKDHLLYLTTILIYLETIPQYNYLLQGRLVSLKTDILYKLEKYNDRRISNTS